MQPLDQSLEGGTALDPGRPSWLGRRPALQGVAWMALASLLFASMNVLARVSSARVPWPQVAMTRALTGALLAYGLSRARGSSLRITQSRRESWMRTLFGTSALLATFYALSAREVPVGDVVTLSALSPMFIALLSPWLLGERVDRRVRVALPVAFLGVTAVVQPTFHVAADVAAIAMLAAMLSAMAMLWLRRIGPGESSEAIVFHFSSFATLVCGIIALPTLRLPDTRGAIALVATGVTGGLAQLALTRAYSLDRAARLAAIGYLGIVFTEILAAVFLDERPSLAQLMGSLLVIGAGVFLAASAWTERSSMPSQNERPAVPNRSR